MATITTLLTADEYAKLPDPGRPTELVHGQVITMPPPMPRHGQLCAQIVYLLRRFLDDNALGHVLSNDSGVITERNPDTVRGADVAYYSFQRVPKGPLTDGLLQVAPELVFEVLSPDDRWSDIHAKVGEYLRAGVRTVCVVDDSTKSIHVFHADRASEAFGADDELKLPEILPGFHPAVQRVFE
ncbi:MAG TPA: Uma2 family endonuclease [Pirellulales bacterium]|jgi:Uma2 family endonuclease|nr:Uma2 family endonuclease [Pirellulales bacterium]